MREARRVGSIQEWLAKPELPIKVTCLRSQPPRRRSRPCISEGRAGALIATFHLSPLISTAHGGLPADEGLSSPPSASQRLRKPSKVETRACPSQEDLQSLKSPCGVGPSCGSGESHSHPSFAHSKLTGLRQAMPPLWALISTSVKWGQ